MGRQYQERWEDKARTRKRERGHKIDEEELKDSNESSVVTKTTRQGHGKNY